MTWPVTETDAPLKKSSQVTLDASGNGVLEFHPDNANQRWLVTRIVVKTNQDSTATTVPVARAALNTSDASAMSDGNNFGETWSGNQDTFEGEMHVSPCDFMGVVFYPPAGSAGSALSGVIGSAVVTGRKYTRRH